MNASKPLRRLAAFALLALAAGSLSAQVPDRDAIPNWSVPATWSPARPADAIGTMTDISFAIPFVAVTPCRIADTRGLGFTGQAGPPILDTGTRTFQISGTVAGVPAQCGIPPGADAVSFQFTIVSPNTNGNLIAWPAGGPVPTVSVLNWSAGEVALGNGTIVPLSAGGALSVRINAAVGSAVGHLVIDVNGYFSDSLIAGNQFVVNASIAATGAIHGINPSGVDLSAGVRGNASAATGRTFGVFGETASTTLLAAGVVGLASATSGLSVGTFGQTASATSGAAGMFGNTLSTNSRNYGVWGQASGFGGSAGVFGTDATGVTPALEFHNRAGVRGEAVGGFGVLGVTRTATGVYGAAVDAAGTTQVSGALAFRGTADYGVASFGPAVVDGTLWVTGNFMSANKYFVEPHPYDASKEIRYVSLEGPHAEVYFRGTAQVSRGITRIAIPQDFRFVADPATYSTLVTPVGAMATVAVVSEGEEGVLVQASRDVRIHYVVYAERKAFKNPDPIAQNEHFRPERDHDIFRSMPESYRKLLMQNGTLNPDGTLNLETARRLGWDRMWEKRSAPAPAAPVE